MMEELRCVKCRAQTFVIVPCVSNREALERLTAKLEEKTGFRTRLTSVIPTPIEGWDWEYWPRRDHGPTLIDWRSRFEIWPSYREVEWNQAPYRDVAGNLRVSVNAIRVSVGMNDDGIGATGPRVEFRNPANRVEW